VSLISTPAILLRAHDYGDSSSILRFYTRDHGLVSVVARGVRGRSGKGTAVLSSYASGELSAFVKAQRDLHTMKDFRCTSLRDALATDVLRFGGAAAAAELVLAHAESESQLAVFSALEAAFDALAGTPRETLPGAVLAALWTITESFGFAPQLDSCIRCDTPLGPDDIGRFDFSAGGVRCPACSEDSAGPRIGPIARGQLEALLLGGVPQALTHTRQHLALVSDFIAYHVVSKPLKSLRFLASVLPADDVEVPVG
jgi:DNA repair protein RecO (recombination protein O)